MRVLVAVSLLALTLAGCTAPEEEATNRLFGVCPQWIEAAAPEALTFVLDGSEQMDVWPPGNGSWDSHDGYPVDRYTLHFTNVSLEGDAELRVFADEADRRLAFTDYRDPDSPRLIPVATIGDGAVHELDVFLTAIAHGTAPAPDALRMVWSGQGTGTVELEIRAGYRVCGAPV